MKKLNTKGIAHIATLAVVVIGVAAFGTYMLVASRAATCKDYTWYSGKSGSCVKNIQILANHKLSFIPTYGSPLISEDGQFGSQTKAGIIRIQKKWGLTADGVVGTKTWLALCSTGTISAYAGGDFSSAAKTAAHNSGCAGY